MNAKRPYIPDGCDQQGRLTPTTQAIGRVLRPAPVNVEIHDYAGLHGVIDDRMLDDLRARNRQRAEAVKDAHKQVR